MTEVPPIAIARPTLTALFAERVRQTPQAVAMRWRCGDRWLPVTYQAWDRQARAVANGLLSLGLNPGDRVAILSANRPEWHVCDLGALRARGVVVPLYCTASPSQVIDLLADAGATIVFVEDPAQWEKVAPGRSQLPELRTVILMTGEVAGAATLGLPDLLRLGGEYEHGHPGELEHRLAAVASGDCATIVYTSGTTGTPKGARLTHANLVETFSAGIEFLHLADGQRLVSYLSLAHIFERLISEWAAVSFGGEVWFAESAARLPQALQDCRPTLFIGVPRVFEKLRDGVVAGLGRRLAVTRGLVGVALGAQARRIDREQAGRRIPLGLRVRCRVLDRSVLSALRRSIGLDACRVAIAGAAPTPPEVLVFVNALGVPLVEGYGLTESSGPITVNPPGHNRIGTVGVALPGVEVSLAPDGEILVRGPTVFAGYLSDRPATAGPGIPGEAAAGILRTGDIGGIDADGYLTITDRKKDLIITAGGKNLAPQAIESRLMADPLVSHAVVIGNGRPYVTALLTLDAPVARQWADEHGISLQDAPDLASCPEVLGAVAARVARVNSSLSRPEQVKRWTLLPQDFAEGSGEVTPTAKARRKAIADRYAADIEAMYGGS